MLHGGSRKPAQLAWKLRADDHVGVLVLRDMRDECFDKRDGLVGRLVHLPVGSDELLTCHLYVISSVSV